jgi:hypothetical protein
VVALGAALLPGLLGGSLVPAGMLFVLLALDVIALGLAWARDGREAVSAGTLLRIPLYVLWKIPVYLKLVRGGQSEWVRTERTED